jgi:hypothetical protein
MDFGNLIDLCFSLAGPCSAHARPSAWPPIYMTDVGACIRVVGGGLIFVHFSPSFNHTLNYTSLVPSFSLLPTLALNILVRLCHCHWCHCCDRVKTKSTPSLLDLARAGVWQYILKDREWRRPELHMRVDCRAAPTDSLCLPLRLAPLGPT